MLKKSFLYGLILLIIISCAENESNENVEISDMQVSITTMIDKEFSINQFEQAGWKKNKKLDNDIFPNTKEIWYGFFNKRDVEIWVYNSHLNAVSDGTIYAEEAISKRPTNRDPTNPTSITYHAYAIVGNTLLLCEDQLSDCMQLINLLE